MGKRLDLHEIFVDLLGSRQVYFQPPATVKMSYPAIVYHRNDASSLYADNKLYRFTKRYMVTIIDRNPDSGLPEKVAELPLSRFVRYFAADNLNHDVYDVYF